MNTEKILKLIDAGFTAEEIRSFSTSTPSTPPTPDPAQPAAKEPQADPEPAAKTEPEPAAKGSEEIENKLAEKVAEALKPFEDLYNKMAVLSGMPALGSVEPKGMDDVIEHFLEDY